MVYARIFLDLAMNLFLIPAAPQLVRDGEINYLISDYLSEITMSLLTAAKRKSPVCMNFKPYLIINLKQGLK